VQVPQAVLAIAAGRAITPVWKNELGGLTFELTGPATHSFVKWAPTGSDIDLHAEAQRLCWAIVFTPVPAVLDSGSDDEGDWLVTEAIPGESAVSARGKADPRTAVSAIGEGLRALHEVLPTSACPFEWRAESRVAEAERRVAAGLVRPVDWLAEHRALSVDVALARLAEIPPSDGGLVVCHGDACAPNTLLDEQGRWTGHVDLGALGIGDRWADLAVATWSTVWNYGPGWEQLLLDAYGIAPDLLRIAYYRLLWDLA
jgi:kanamycin kinase